MDKPPIEGIPSFTPRTLGVIAHFQNVVGAAEVWFGGHTSAVGILAHSVDIWDHDPVVSVDKKLHKPLIHRVRMDIAEQHEVPQDHQTLDMVTIGSSLNSLDYGIKRQDPGSATIE